jgi:hypothetical protein
MELFPNRAPFLEHEPNKNQLCAADRQETQWRTIEKAAHSAEPSNDRARESSGAFCLSGKRGWGPTNIS